MSKVLRLPVLESRGIASCGRLRAEPSHTCLDKQTLFALYAFGVDGSAVINAKLRFAFLGLVFVGSAYTRKGQRPLTLNLVQRNAGETER